jgi:hypothetical protein
MTNNGIPPIARLAFAIALLVAIFTGFGNMPLYGRYYIADWPGLAWAGDFIVNVQVHYLSGAVLIAWLTYLMLNNGKKGAGDQRFTRSGRWRLGLLALTLVSGLIMAIKNLAGVDFPLIGLMAANFLHMGAAVLLILFVLVGAIGRMQWLR